MMNEDSNIPSVLREWSGGQSLAARLSDAGFMMHQRFVEFTAGIAGRAVNQWQEDLAEYANEYVRSAGRPSGSTAHLLLHVRRRLILDAALRDAYAPACQKWLDAEAKPDLALQNTSSEQRSYLRILVQAAAKATGFQLTKTGYVVSVGRVLELDVEVETGRRGSLVRQLVVYNRLLSKNANWEMWLPWDELLPGMDMYMSALTPSQTAWGIKAFIMASSIFASTFQNPTDQLQNPI